MDSTSQRLLLRIHSLPQFCLNRLGEMHGSAEVWDAYERLTQNGFITTDKQGNIALDKKALNWIAEKSFAELSNHEKKVLGLFSSKNGQDTIDLANNLCMTPKDVYAVTKTLVEHKTLVQSGGHLFLTDIGVIQKSML